ncbi:MAG: hypothetical protein C3F02_01685 [Parcubacteria group bacterium]|nr:MAG: hypothetical protein C3F02_01685 [Parcubacteria group bacterium]
MLAKLKTLRVVKWLLYLTIIFVLCLLIFFLSNIAISSIYVDKFLRGTRVAGVDISGLSLEDAKAKIDKRLDFVRRRGFVYRSEVKTVTINPNLQAVDSPDASYELVRWDVDGTLGYILSFEQTKNPMALWKKIKILAQGENFPLGYDWHRARQAEILQQNFSDTLIAEEDATFEFVGDSLKINTEKSGQSINFKKALDDTQRIIERLDNTDIDVQIINAYPTVSAAMIRSLQSQIESFIGQGDLTLLYNDQKWTVPATTWRQWLVVRADSNRPLLGFAEDAFKDYLERNNIKSVVEKPVQEAKFQLADNRVTEFVASQDGRSLDWAENINRLEKLKVANPPLSIDLAVTIVKSTLQNQDVNQLGIVGLLGTGTSDFKGSPPNRIHNIEIGAKTLNGILITPEEEFSLLKALGEVDGEHGYLQELVIKGNKTIPEFGGGLCQIGTTVFRGALASGLPILERRNHSYRVRYYEPAGMDATIYNPWPDLKFKNDTGKYILIQTRIEGTKLYFDFWGTADGRIAQTTEPVIYNIVVPPEKKIVKTIDLPVGKTKCTESAHNGADAKFTYTVQYPGENEPREEIFYSHYVPWQEVCLLGVTEEELLLEQNSTSTPAL